MSPRAPENAPRPPVTVHTTAPLVQPSRGAGATVPRPTVSNVTPPARPYVMVPSSTKLPSANRSTTDSRIASSPSSAFVSACTPSLPITVVSDWLAAVRRELSARKATVGLPGGDLVIEWRESDGHVLMTGPAALDWDGVLEPGLFAAVA